MRTRLPILFLLASLPILLFPNVNCPATSKAERIDELLSDCHELDMFNGCALVAEQGDEIYSKAFGYADYET